jgi:2-keto-4-pentenoate hydratase/2-oxohepta-3-ene-1,7-dioic acid hydratase in catechol pathway
MVFHIDQLIAFASSIMTLEPGDVIMTGTPAGISPLHPGDIVEVTIDGLGKLRNPVELEKH